MKEVLPTLRQLGYEASLCGRIPPQWLPLEVREYVANAVTAAEVKTAGPVAAAKHRTDHERAIMAVMSFGHVL